MNLSVITAYLQIDSPTTDDIMLGFLKGDPKKKLQKAYNDKLAKALHAQRNGDLRKHATLMEEADGLYEQIQAQGRTRK